MRAGLLCVLHTCVFIFNAYTLFGENDNSRKTRPRVYTGNRRLDVPTSYYNDSNKILKNPKWIRFSKLRPGAREVVEMCPEIELYEAIVMLRSGWRENL